MKEMFDEVVLDVYMIENTDVITASDKEYMGEWAP